MNSDSTESNSNKNCIVCFRQFECHENTVPETNKVYKIFTTCSSYLKPEVFTNSSNWESLTSSEKVSLFCDHCFTSGEKLSSMDDTLTKIQKQIESFVENFTKEILIYRKEKPSFVVAPSKIKQEVIPTALSSLLIKEEGHSDSELYGSESGFLPSPDFIDESSETHFENSIDDENILVSIKPKNPSVSGTRKTRTQLRKITIPVKRLQNDEIKRYTRQAAKNDSTVKVEITDNDSGSDFENESDQSYTDDSSSSSGSNEEYKRKKCHQRRKIRSHNVSEKRDSSVKTINKCKECDFSTKRKDALRNHILHKHADLGKTFDCEFCGVQRKSERAYREHKRRHYREFKCEDCGKVFNKHKTLNQYDYEIHCMGHRDEIPFECQICHEKFSNVSNYSNHQKFSSCGKSGMGKLKCEKCGRIFYYKYLLLLHHLDHSSRKNLSGEHVKCEICDKSYKYDHKHKYGNLEPHYLMHTNEKSLTCDICGMPFNEKNVLSQHRQSHKADYLEPEYRCDHCSKTFSSQRNLNLHMENKHIETNERFPCETCDKVLKTKKLYNQHIRKHITTLPCEICGKKFSTNGALIRHTRIHTGEFTCPECDLKCMTENVLKTHIAAVHRKEKRFECKLCGEGFCYSKGYKVHMRRHSQPQSFTCEICSGEFKREYDFKAHMKIHTGKGLDATEFPFICDACGKMFKHPQSLKAHNDIHHSAEAEEFKCDQCDKTFSTKAYLTGHVKRIHEERVDLNLPCEVCGKTYRTERELNTHVKTHTVAIPCGICEKTFPSSSQVYVHRRNMHTEHTGEKYPCDKCEREFRNAGQLKTHVSSVHMKIIRHCCEICGKGFYKRTSYKEHLETHSDQKTWQCKECSEWFNTRHKLRDHCRKMHTGETFVCQPCGKTFLRKATLNLHIKKHHSANSLTTKTKGKLPKRSKHSTPLSRLQSISDQASDSGDTSAPLVTPMPAHQTQPFPTLYHGHLQPPTHYNSGAEPFWWHK